MSANVRRPSWIRTCSLSLAVCSRTSPSCQTGRWALKDAYMLIPETCDSAALPGRRALACVVKTVREGDYPSLSGQAQSNNMSSSKQRTFPGWGREEMRWKKSQRDAMLLAVKIEEGARAKECRQPLQTGKGKKTASPIEPTERNAALPTPWY